MLAVGVAKAWMDQQYPAEKNEKAEQVVKSGGKEAKDKKAKLVPVVT
jgi:hypothetical protein